MTDEQTLRKREVPERDEMGTDRLPIRVVLVTAAGDEAPQWTDFEKRQRFDVLSISPDELLDGHDLSTVDCLVCAYRLPDGTGMDVLDDARAVAPSVPFVLVSEETVEGLATEALAAGVADYVHRPPGESADLLARRVRAAVDGPPSDSTGPARRRDEAHGVYRALEASQGGVSLLDEDGEFVYVNQAYADLYAYSPEEMLGMHWEAIYPDDEVDRVHDDILPSVDEGGTWSGETTGLRADGSTFVEDLSLSATADGGLLCTVHDVTEQRERARIVERYRSVVEDVFGESEIGVFVLDSSFDVAWSNEAAEEYFGLDGETVVGRTMAGLVDERLSRRLADPARFVEQVTDAHEADDPVQEFEVHLEATDESPERYLHHRSQRIESGEYAGGRLELYYDVTERKRQERELRKNKERLEVATSAGSVGIWTWEFETDIVTADAYLTETYGMDPETAAAGAPIDEFFGAVHPADRDSVWRELDRAVEETDEFEAEYRVRDADGETLWVVSRAEVEYDETGEQLRMNGALTDVTEQKQRQNELRDTRERLEAAMTVGSVGTWDWNVDDDEVTADAALADLFDIDRTVAQSGTGLEQFLQSIHEADRERVEAAIERTVETGEPFEEEYRVHAAHDDIRWVLARGELGEGDETPQRFSGALTDITERKRVEEELKESQRYLRELYEITSNTGTAFETTVDDLLRMGCERLGLKYGFLIDIDGDEFEVSAMHGTHETFHEGLSASVDQTFCKHVVGSGECFSFHDVALAGYEDDPAADSGLHCYIGAEVDIGNESYGTFCFADTEPQGEAFSEAEETFVELMAEWVSYGLERRRAEEALERTAERLRQSNDRLERFAYIASHDLREPLRMVSSYVQLLEQRYVDELDDDAREFIEFAADGADRMQAMIDGLLRYSRVDTQGDPFESTEMDDVLDRALSNLQVAVAERDATVTVDDLPAVTVDETQLMTLFQNLLSNALQYSETSPTVHVGVEERPNDWLFSVRDDGIGIDPDRSEDVFEVFKRLHTNDEYPGTGIGLALCRKIVERHGGTIWIESEPGEGSTFYFTIPEGAAARDHEDLPYVVETTGGGSDD